MAQPLVLVSSDLRDFDGARWHAVRETYLAAVVEGAGAAAVGLPAIGAGIDFEALLSRVDGIVLTGSRSNVHPTRYGTAATPAHEPFDPDRDAAALPLIQAALARDLPMLCICRGMQELNVALGGTLANAIEDRPGGLDHRAAPGTEPAERYAIQHPVDVTAGGLLERCVGAGRIAVNSLHQQAIDRLGAGLAVEATAPDGTIEAISHPGKRFVLGVQWHPEFWFRTDPPSASLFRSFGKALRD